MWTALLGLIGPLVQPLADLAGKLFGAWLAYRAGANQQRADDAERAMEVARDVRKVADDRASVPLSDRRERVRDRFARRP